MNDSLTMRLPDGQPVIETRNLTKVYPPAGWLARRRAAPRPSVDNVSLSVGTGQILGLVGPNGAGKTTLIRMLSTLLVPTSGSATVAGGDLVRDDRQVRHAVGLVTSNERSFYWRLSGRENLAFFASLYKVDTRDGRAWREELIDTLGMRDVIDLRFDHYSTGQKQRLAIARGLLTRPRILLMDEPTKGVDPVGARDLINLVRDRIVACWNPTILITSHNLHEIERLCHRIALMHHGRILAEGTLEDLRRLIRPQIHYRLRVIGLEPGRVAALGAAAGPPAPPAVGLHQSIVELEIDFEDPSDGFGRLVTALVREGGELVECHSHVPGIEEVFHAILEGRTGGAPSPVPAEALAAKAES